MKARFGIYESLKILPCAMNSVANLAPKTKACFESLSMWFEYLLGSFFGTLMSEFTVLEAPDTF